MGGISARGATKIIMFGGIINARRLGIILEAGLLPFIAEKFSDGHRLFHDNDPKHASEYIEIFFKHHNVNWWPTPPESPDLNPIENVWGSLKQYLRTHYKPKNLQELKWHCTLLDDTYTGSMSKVHQPYTQESDTKGCQCKW